MFTRNDEKLQKRLFDHCDDLMRLSGADVGDLKDVLGRLKRARIENGHLVLDGAGMSEAQVKLCNALVESVVAGGIGRAFAANGSPSNFPKHIIYRRGNRDVVRGVNAAKLLIFVMDIEEVDEKVGDALEHFEMVKDRFGDTLAVWHYRWTIIVIFINAILNNMLFKRIAAFVERMINAKKN